MKNKFYLILLTLTFILTACEEKSQDKQNPTIVLEVTKDKASKKIIPKEQHYEFKNSKNQLNVLHVKNDVYDFKNIKQEIVIVNVMSTWCPPCRGQIPHLSKLQKKFKKNVFVISALVHDDISKEKLDKLIVAQKILFYLSVSQEENLKFVDCIIPKLGLAKDFPLPLTILFVRGKYFTHYEGMIPEEMIESDIKQLLEKIKK